MTSNPNSKESPRRLDVAMPVAVDVGSTHSISPSDTGRSGRTIFVPGRQRIGKYQIVAELGRGGAASVSLAVARGKGGVRKLVVLKALLPELAEEQDAVSAFLEEARLAAQLNHPNVVQTYEVGTESGRHVIVMEYLDGQSLSRIIRTANKEKQAFPDALHLRILSEVLEGLHYAHELKSYDGRHLRLVHRDVSPQNVIVTYDGQVKILDFGIAKAATSSTHTAAGIIKGKIAYMAPEQMSGGSEVDRRADIYSVGCMLWAAIAGQKLWQDMPDVQVVRAVISGKIPSPKTIRRDCPDELEAIVMRALCPDPDQRYATAREFQSALDSFAEKLSRTVKSRDVAEFVLKLFATSRAEFSENLERELAAVMAGDDLSDQRGSMASISDPQSQFPAAGTAEPGSAASSASRVRTAQSTRGRWAWSTLLGIGLLGTLAWGNRTKFLPAPSALAPSTAAPSAPPTALVSTERSVPSSASSDTTLVTIQLAIVPQNSRLTLDGRALADGTSEVSLPVGAATHELIAESEGYAREVRSFTVTAPAKVTITLQPKAGVKKPRSLRSYAPVPKSPVPPPTAAERKPAAESCENPIFVDSQGIKRVRPNCL